METERKHSFAQAMALCCDPEQAALMSGSDVENAARDGIALLYDSSVSRQLGRYLREKRKLYGVIRAGLEKIAFNRCNDAVELAFADPGSLTRDVIRKMDLSCLTAIKRDKDGGVDIKLIDRQKALESLMQLCEGEEDRNAESFLKALCGGEGRGEE